MPYETKRMGIVGFCLATMLIAGMALAGSATAAPLWLVCLKGAGLTKYSNSKCLEASGIGEWQSEGVSGDITVKLLTFTLTLHSGLFTVQCFDSGSRWEGVLEGENKGKIVVAGFEKPNENCRGVEGCEKNGIESEENFNIPWRFEVFETESKLLTEIPSGGPGEVGWEWRCKELGQPQSFRCFFAKTQEQAELKNEVTTNPAGIKELLVKGLFESRGSGCTLSGSFAILLPGGALSIDRQ